jgi:hypothetical protein
LRDRHLCLSLNYSTRAVLYCLMTKLYVLGVKTSVLPTSIWHSQMEVVFIVDYVVVHIKGPTCHPGA